MADFSIQRGRVSGALAYRAELNGLKSLGIEG